MVQCLKAKIYLLYGQSYSKVGLLTNYKNAVADKPTMFEYSNPKKVIGVSQSSNVLSYAGCQWKVNVVLSTNVLDKVMRPEIVLEMQSREGRVLKLTLSSDKFEELRRQMALLLRQGQQIECVKYLIF